MKTKVNKDGIIRIKAETIEEGFTLKHLFEISERCSNCNFPKGLVLFDHSILYKKKKTKKSDTITEK